MPAVKPLKRSGHSDPGTSAYPPGDLDIPLASLRMKPVRLLRQDKEPFHTLQGKISGSMIVLSSSHVQDCGHRVYKPISSRESISTSSENIGFNGCYIAFHQDRPGDGGLYPRSLYRYAHRHHLRRPSDLLRQDQSAQAHRSCHICWSAYGLHLCRPGSLYQDHRCEYASALRSGKKDP